MRREEVEATRPLGAEGGDPERARGGGDAAGMAPPRHAPLAPVEPEEGMPGPVQGEDEDDAGLLFYPADGDAREEAGVPIEGWEEDAPRCPGVESL